MSGPYAAAAALYQRKGWSPVPLPPRSKSTPPVGWTGYAAPMASGADVAEWASNGRAAGNVALRTPETVLGLDVDNYDGKPGLATVLEAADRLGPLPKTWCSTSRGGGVSGIRVYRVPPGRRWADVLGPGVEVIHYGHRYLVAAPSIHPEGRTYAWYGPDGRPVDDPPAVEDLPALPAAWVSELDRGDIAERAAKADLQEPEVLAFLEGLPTGDPCRYVVRLIAAATGELTPAASRHDVARNFVARMVRAGDQGHRGVVVGLDTLQSVWLRALAQGKPRDPDPGEWARMLTGAVAIVAKDPSTAVDKGCCPSEETDPTPKPGGLVDDLREGMHHGQLRMAYRLANSNHRDRLLHVHGVGWHRWDGKRWAFDDQGHAVRAVRQVLRRALEESLNLDDDAAKAIRRDVDKCSSASGAAGVLALAATMSPFAATVADLDTDPYLLNVANGTLDLRTLQLRPHDPADRITKVTTAAYTSADGGQWVTFLTRVLPDPEVRGFLQRLAGLALLGRVVEHVLGIMTGVGANGKGVFTRALEHALGDYASTAEADLFMKREGAHPTGEMDLRGRRWVTVSETDQGRQLAEATMKRLTGGDTIKARKMRQDFVEFQPSHTAVLVTNHLPEVRGDDPAIWRRIRVVPFDVVIPEAERDKHLDETLQLQAEAVLAWAVAGYRDYATRGDLGEPQAVLGATSAYRLDSDPVARFVEDECLPTPYGYTESGALYARWQKWAAEDGTPEMTAKAFGQTLGRKGYPADRVNNRRLRRGLLLTDGGEQWPVQTPPYLPRTDAPR